LPAVSGAYYEAKTKGSSSDDQRLSGIWSCYASPGTKGYAVTHGYFPAPTKKAAIFHAATRSALNDKPWSLFHTGRDQACQVVENKERQAYTQFMYEVLRTEADFRVTTAH
jgi:hypothetical protein